MFYFMFPLKKSSKIYRLPKRVWSYTGYIVLMAIEDDEKLNIKTRRKSLLGFWHANTIIKKLEKRIMSFELVKNKMNVTFKFL